MKWSDVEWDNFLVIWILLWNLLLSWIIVIISIADLFQTLKIFFFFFSMHKIETQSWKIVTWLILCLKKIVSFKKTTSAPLSFIFDIPDLFCSSHSRSFLLIWRS